MEESLDMLVMSIDHLGVRCLALSIHHAHDLIMSPETAVWVVRVGGRLHTPRN